MPIRVIWPHALILVGLVFAAIGAYGPVLSFQTLAGQQIETRAADGNSNPTVEIGQPVRVIYDPANPGVAEIDTFGVQASALLLQLACAAVGIGLAVAGVVTMVGR